MTRVTIRYWPVLILLCAPLWPALSQTTNGSTTGDDPCSAAAAAPAPAAGGGSGTQGAGLPAIEPVDLSPYESLSAADRASLQHALQVGWEGAMARIAAAHDTSVRQAVDEAVAAVLRIYLPREKALCAQVATLEQQVDQAQRATAGDYQDEIAALRRQLAEHRIINGLVTAGTALASFFVGHELGGR